LTYTGVLDIVMQSFLSLPVNVAGDFLIRKMNPRSFPTIMTRFTYTSCIPLRFQNTTGMPSGALILFIGYTVRISWFSYLKASQVYNSYCKIKAEWYTRALKCGTIHQRISKRAEILPVINCITKKQHDPPKEAGIFLEKK